LYWQPGNNHLHTLLFRASAAGGWSVETPFQLTLGGRDNLRGFRDEAYPGGRRIILTLEDRVFLPSPTPGLVDLGLAFFVDLGHMHSGDAPFGSNPHWVGTVGAGLRLGLPPGTTNTIRIDLAFPVGDGAQLKDLILRVNLRELVGILPGLTDRQILRSLRNGVRPTFVTAPW
ncbi:MAG: BamA/TamA family outer membrane protein, partial [Gemmatimonadetes bacterium]|nr:BamA/TamA family outer membrane protein [Gemmatimonadota bacterium]NNM04246.1 BamA/TamA family outer membrane protein [Gemmatimonadota bacterium]